MVDYLIYTLYCKASDILQGTFLAVNVQAFCITCALSFLHDRFLSSFSLLLKSEQVSLSVKCDITRSSVLGLMVMVELGVDSSQQEKLHLVQLHGLIVENLLHTELKTQGPILSIPVFPRYNM